MDRDTENIYSLWSASKGGNLPEVRRLLAFFPTPSQPAWRRYDEPKDSIHQLIPMPIYGTRFVDYTTCLHEACRSGHLEIVLALLDKAGVNSGLDVKDSPHEKTALHFAAEEGHVEVVSVLLERGADINAKAYSGTTPLHHASKKGQICAVRALIARGADINSKAQFGRTPLNEASSQGHVDVVTELLTRDAEIETDDETGLSALLEASEAGSLEVVRLLLEHGASPDKHPANEDASSPIESAAGRGHLEVVEELLKHGADVEGSSKFQETALHNASRRGHDKIVRMLLDHGADPHAKTSGGYTALHGICQAGFSKLPWGYEGDSTTLEWLLPERAGRKDAFRLLLAHDISLLTDENNKGLTPLMVASPCDRNFLVCELLRNL